MKSKSSDRGQSATSLAQTINQYDDDDSSSGYLGIDQHSLGIRCRLTRLDTGVIEASFAETACEKL